MDEAKKIILKESEVKEMYQITCEGEPVEVCETPEIANKHLNIYKKKHPEKEFIIEKVTYNSTSEMIDKLDEMGEKLEMKENKDMKKFKAKNLAEAIMDAHEKGISKIKVGEESYDVTEMYSELEEVEGVCEQCGYKMEEESDMEENAFVLAADAARDAGKKEFEFPKGSGKMHKVTLKKEIDTNEGNISLSEKLTGKQHKIDANKNNKIDAEDFKMLKSKKKEVNENVDQSMVDEIGQSATDMMMNVSNPCGEYNDEFQFADSMIKEAIDMYLSNMEIEDVDVENSLFDLVKDQYGDEIMGYYVQNCDENEDNGEEVDELYESKKKTLRLNETQLIGLIEKIVKKTKTIKESVPGLEVTKKAQSGSKKENDTHMKDVEKKLKDYSTFDGNDNPEFPKQVGKGEKMTVKNTDEQNDDLETNGNLGMLDLTYDYEPSEQFKKRLKMALEGDPKMGNSQEAANVIKTETGEKISKIAEKKKKAREKEKQISWGHSWQSPEKVVVVKESKTESKQILEEEIKRMKNIAGYDKKTQ